MSYTTPILELRNHTPHWSLKSYALSLVNLLLYTAFFVFTEQTCKNLLGGNKTESSIFNNPLGLVLRAPAVGAIAALHNWLIDALHPVRALARTILALPAGIGAFIGMHHFMHSMQDHSHHHHSSHDDFFHKFCNAICYTALASGAMFAPMIAEKIYSLFASNLMPESLPTHQERNANHWTLTEDNFRDAQDSVGKYGMLLIKQAQKGEAATRQL